MPANAKQLQFWDQVPQVNKDDAYAALRARRFERDEVYLIIDARMQCYRAWYTRDLTSKDGESTSVLHGLLEMVQNACEAANTQRWVLCWDGGLRYKRKIFSGYKDRHDKSQTPDEARERHEREVGIKLAREWLDNIVAPQISTPDVEADDLAGIAGTAALRNKLGRVVYFSDDKDYYQLIRGDDAMVWRGTRKELVDQADFFARHNFAPDRYADYKALVGEPATGDNIPGVKSVGDITACKLVATHGSLEGVIRFCESRVKQGGKLLAVEKAIYQHRDQARMSYKLARISLVAPDLAETGEVDVDRVRTAVKNGLWRARHAERRIDRSAIDDLKHRLGFTTFDIGRWCDVCGFAR